MLKNLVLHAGPSWRYREVERCLRQKPVGKPRISDEFIDNYISLVTRLKKAKSNVTEKIISQNETLSPYLEVHYIMSNSYGVRKIGENSMGADFTRSILDAHALCDEDPEETAELLGISPKAIEVYEALAFDVRDKPKMWVVSKVLSPIVNSFATGNFDSLLKFAAVALGSNAVSQLLFQNALNAEDVEKLRQTVFGWRLIKSAASSIMIPTNSFNSLDFERDVNSAYLDEQKLELQKKNASGEDLDESDNYQTEVMKTLFGEKPITISSKYKPNPSLDGEEEEVVSTNLQDILNESAVSNDVVR